MMSGNENRFTMSLFNGMESKFPFLGIVHENIFLANNKTTFNSCFFLTRQNSLCMMCCFCLIYFLHIVYVIDDMAMTPIHIKYNATKLT